MCPPKKLRSTLPHVTDGAALRLCGPCTTAETLRANPPWYCDSAATNYTFSSSWTYNNNQCNYDLDIGEVLNKAGNTVYITTYIQDTPVYEAAATAAGLAAGNYFVAGVEGLTLSFDHTATTSWVGRCKLTPNTPC